MFEQFSSPHNSTNLQKNFLEIYQNFFAQNTIIVSSNLHFDWIKFQRNDHEVFSLKQKVPLKFYLGISNINQSTITPGIITTYNPNNKRFETISFSEFNPRLNKLFEYLNITFLTKLKTGFTINILVETTAGRFTNFSNQLSSTLATCLLLKMNKISIKDIENFPKFKISTLLNNTQLKLTKILNMAITIHKQFNDNTFSNDSIIASLINFNYPLITHINEKQILAQRFSDLFHKDTNSFLQIDFGLIYSGISVNQELKLPSSQVLYQSKEHLKKFAGKIFHKSITPNKLTHISINYDLPLLYYKIIKILSEIYQNSYDLQKTLQLVQLLKKLNNLNEYQYTYSNYNTNLRHKFKYLIHQKSPDQEIEILQPANTHLGGSFMFVSFLETKRKKIYKTIETIQKEKIFDINLDYASWRDGIINDGIKVEQNLDTNNISPLLQNSKIKINTFQKNNISSKYLFSYDQLSDLQNKHDLVLDLIKNKIIINGKKITSKDLHSQSATIKILKLLLKNKNEPLKNIELPRSSYSFNKNEMYSKIILPLKKAIKKHCHKEIQLSCYGGLHDFYIKLNPSDLRISTINNSHWF